MKKVLIYIFIILLISACKAQQLVVESKSADVLVFEFMEDNTNKIKPLSEGANKATYHKDNLHIISQRWAGYGSRYIKKEYTFISNNDTMQIACICGQERNYYFKNLKFNQGNYQLSFENQELKTHGDDISSDNETLNILFNNTYVSTKKRIFQNLRFKKIEFTEIDLNDTLNVKLVPLKE